MDPQATLLQMLAYLRDGDWEEAQDSYTALIEWRERGGFVPDLTAALDGLIEDKNLD